MTDYFDGIRFLFAGDVPGQSDGFVSKSFDGYYGIQYNHSGCFQFALDHAAPEILEGPYAFVTEPGHFFEYGPVPGGRRHHCFVCFTGSRAENFKKHSLMPSDPHPVRIVKAERFYSTFQELYNLLKQPGTGHENPRKVLLLEDLFLQLHEQPEETIRVNAFCEECLKNLRSAISEAPWKNWNFESEAGKMSISYSHFRRIFRVATGCAPNRFLIESRLNFAARLLTGTVLPLREVAHRSGFPDEFYFSRIFRQYKHCTPSGYRKELR